MVVHLGFIQLLVVCFFDPFGDRLLLPDSLVFVLAYDDLLSGNDLSFVRLLLVSRSTLFWIDHRTYWITSLEASSQ